MVSHVGWQAETLDDTADPQRISLQPKRKSPKCQRKREANASKFWSPAHLALSKPRRAPTEMARTRAEVRDNFNQLKALRNGSGHNLHQLYSPTVMLRD